MCKQSYLNFEACGCQLRHRLLECHYGRTSPECKYVRSLLVRARSDRCPYHKRVQQQREEAWAFYWASRGRRLWPAPPLFSQPIPALEQPIPNEEMEVDTAYSDLFP
ncbi:hypothetical protein SLS62_010650 [Diatrype stigma]|uniref:Uncharacterized protein n=1 Tax=Diatrype stigma TaxID=117547 RepID=A0AAN9YHT0_9PEZI